MIWLAYLLLAATVFILAVLALGPAYIQVRDWFNNRGHF